jgi:hypothetical protein
LQQNPSIPDINKFLKRFNIKTDFEEFKTIKTRCKKYKDENHPIDIKIKKHLIFLKFRD